MEYAKTFADNNANDNIQIRKAIISELPIIQKLAFDIWPATYAPILSKEQIDYMLNLFYSHEALLRDYKKNGYQFFILKYADVDSGYAGVEQINNEHWHLHKIYLSFKLQGKGLGKALINYVENIAQESSATFLSLDVNRYNKAQGFYKSQGYEITKEKDTDIGNGFWMNDYVMKKDL